MTKIKLIPSMLLAVFVTLSSVSAVYLMSIYHFTAWDEASSPNAIQVRALQSKQVLSGVVQADPGEIEVAKVVHNGTSYTVQLVYGGWLFNYLIGEDDVELVSVKPPSSPIMVLKVQTEDRQVCRTGYVYSDGLVYYSDCDNPEVFSVTRVDDSNFNLVKMLVSSYSGGDHYFYQESGYMAATYKISFTGRGNKKPVFSDLSGFFGLLFY